MLVRPRRSVLYMPGSNAKAVAKAATLPADALILDLEDSVAPDAKIAARRQVGGGRARARLRRTRGHHPRQRPAYAAGEKTISPRRSPPVPTRILLPKVDSPGEIMLAARALREGGAPERTRFWAMMETPNAILNAGSIAAVAADPASRLEALVMGLNDLAKETRARLTPGRSTMIVWLARCVVAARAHGVDVIDGVFNDIKDLEGFRAECVQGRDMGFDGKTLIHPSQIDACNEAFAPSPEEVESARAIIEAFAMPENAGRGAIQLNGRMVELLHADMARRTLAIADAITALSQAAA